MESSDRREHPALLRAGEIPSGGVPSTVQEAAKVTFRTPCLQV